MSKALNMVQNNSDIKSKHMKCEQYALQSHKLYKIITGKLKPEKPKHLRV